MSRDETSEQRPKTHTLIVRAIGAEQDCAQIKVTFYSEPAIEVQQRYEAATASVYRSAFGEEPAVVGRAVLPYSEKHDGDEEHR